jgi:hypothetical protein
MAASEVQICNMALGRIGISIFIDALSEASQEASVCNVFYEQCRDRALSEGYFNFTTARVALADLGTPPTNWLYRYAMPSDCLTARYIEIEGSRNPLAKNRIPFEVAQEGNVKVLYTDQPEAELVYTRRITNPNLFSPQCVSAIAWLLGSEIGMPLSAAPNLVSAAARMYENAISQAQSASSNEGQGDTEPDCEFLSGRN